MAMVREIRRAPPNLSGRWRKGLRPVAAKLSELDVLRIRQWAHDHPHVSIYRQVRYLRRHYPVAVTTLEDILMRRSWQHVPEETLTSASSRR